MSRVGWTTYLTFLRTYLVYIPVRASSLFLMTQLHSCTPYAGRSSLLLYNCCPGSAAVDQEDLNVITIV